MGVRRRRGCHFHTQKIYWRQFHTQCVKWLPTSLGRRGSSRRCLRLSLRWYPVFVGGDAGASAGRRKGEGRRRTEERPVGACVGRCGCLCGRLCAGVVGLRGGVCGCLCGGAPTWMPTLHMCTCASTACPWDSLRTWLVNAGAPRDREKLQELATENFSCPNCAKDGNGRGAVSLPIASKPTGVTVLQRDHFSREYATGKVALCGSTKDRAS